MSWLGTFRRKKRGAVLVLPGEDLPPNCNLFAPIVVNVATRKAKQVLQLDSDYPTAFPLTKE